MIGTYASAIAIGVCAILIGRAICVVSGHAGSTWLAPPVGLAALMIICEVTVRLPGRAWTAVAAVIAASLLSVWIGARTGAGWPDPADALPVAVAVLVLVSIPFLANARVGVLGISFLNDTHWHLLVAEGLRRPAIKPLDNYGPGYPLGPHAVAATFAQALGSDVDKTLTGLMMATPTLTGLAALALLADLSRLRRWLVSVLSAIPYLAAAWYVQSAFKEPILALLMLGLVVVLQSAHRQGFTRLAAVVVPGAVLIAGVVYDYSYPGLLWPAAIVVCWTGAELLVSGGWRRLAVILTQLRRLAPGLLLGLVLLVLLVAPDIGRIHTFWLSNGGTSAGTVGGVVKTSLANLAGPLRALEGLNLWLTGDFRFVPTDALKTGALAGFAAVVLAFAIASSLERRELAWPSALLAFGLVYLYVRRSQSPYVAAKALMVPASFVVLGSGAALMRALQRPWRRVMTGLVALVAVVYFGFAFYSEYLVLRDGQVGPNDHVGELRSLRALLHGRPTLVLFYDDYFKWELLGVPASSPLLPSLVPASVQPAKPWSYGQALDFDSVGAATLDRFDYVITTRTAAQSEPPPNFHLVGASRSYEVWRRLGPTTPHEVLPESGRAGAVLDCRTPLGRRISHESGVARVRSAPRYFALRALQPGESEHLVLNLAPGEWELSIPFVAQQAVTVRGAGIDARLPPNLDRPGSIWPVGRIRSDGTAMALTLTMSDPALLSSGSPPVQFFTPQPMVAVRVSTDRALPLRDACGRYLDWYELG